MTLLRWLLRAVVRPWKAFPGPFRSGRDRWLLLVALRLPLEGLALVGLLRWSAGIRAQMVDLQGPMGEALLRSRGALAVEDLRAGLQALPEVPGPGAWLGLAVPLLLLGTWLHHGVWDHAGLWLVGGLGARQGWRATARAEAEALAAGAPGVLAGWLALASGRTWLFPLMVVLGGWFWVQRGFALAAYHRCERWRGVAATVVHGGMLLLLIGACLFLLVLTAWAAGSGP